MDHGKGRHRRRRRGWVSRVRWTVGAVLAAILGVSTPPPSPRPQPRSEPVRKRPPLRAAATPVASVRDEEPEWVRRYDQARREHAGRVRHLYAPPTKVEPLPRFGWCEDDEGGRGVRSYLVAHEQRHRAQRRESGALLKASPSAPGWGVPAGAGGGEPPGEWGELAGLVRRWHAQQQPVA